MTFARILRVDDSGDLQVLQVEGFLGEIRDGVPRISEWGFASNPPADSQAVVLALGGSRGQLVVVGVEDRKTRPKNLPVGASQIHAAGGNRVRCLADGTIEIVNALASVTIAPTGAVTVNGVTVSVTASGAATVNAGGNATISAGGTATVSAPAVSIGSATTIDGKNFLAHTHTPSALGVPTSGVN